MEDLNKVNNVLNIPKVRRSAAIINEIKNNSYSNPLSPILSPRATSTVKKQGLTGLPPQYFQKNINVDNSTYDSSLGILDIDECLKDEIKKTNLSKTLDSIPSMTFNAQEISARSTNDFNSKENKENANPNSNERVTLSNYESTLNDVKVLIEQAKMQSKFTDEIMNSTNYDCADENFKMSLQMLKNANKTDVTNNSNVWRQSLRSNRFSSFPNNEKESNIRDSMFALKINMSEEELECIKDHGTLPVPYSLLNNTKILENSTMSNNPLSDSKMSIGNYFVQRSEKNLLLQSKSPERYTGCPLLSNLETPLNNISNVEPHVLEPKSVTFNIEHSSDNPSINLTNSVNSDDTLTNHLLSLTQIRNFVGKMNTESPSSLLEHMLKEKTKLKSKENPSTVTKTLSDVQHIANYTQCTPKISLNDSTISVNNKKSNQTNQPDMSPGILSVSTDRNYQTSFATSDVSKEIKELMSPFSTDNSDTPINTPLSGRFVKKLVDHFPDSETLTPNKDGWISPSRAQTINLSKECIPSETPFKDANVFKKVISENETEELNINTSLNFPVEGDWIQILSTEQNIITGVSQDICINIESLGSRWLSMNISIENILVDNELYSSNVSDVIVLLEPTANVLLTAQSKIDFNLKIAARSYNQAIKINLKVELLDIVTKSTSVVNHVVKINTFLPCIAVQTVDFKTIDHIDLPLIPKSCEACTSVVLWNESKTDMPIQLNVNNTVPNVFELVNIELISEEEREEKLHLYSKPHSLSNTFDHSVSQKVFILPHNKKAPLIVFIKFQAPNIDSDMIQFVNGALEVLLISMFKSDLKICLKKIPIMAGFGASTLLLRNNKKSDVIRINQGSFENIEIYNAGTLSMQYKIYIALHQDNRSMVPCTQNVFVPEQSEISLKANEKSFIKLHFSCNEMLHDVKRLLVFESPYSTEVFDIVGIANMPRCQSQQSTYSVESVSTPSQEVMLKSTKKELSWGSIKLNECKIQDITFKNVSSTKKIRAIAMVVGEGFKLISECGPVSSLVFTLQPQECRAINLEFKAISLGGHMGTLKIFKRCNNVNSDDSIEPKLLFKAPLHGMCGQSKLVFKDGVFRHAGAQGLPLGPLNDSGYNKQIYFTIWNKGTTRGFALFNIDLKWKYRTLGNEVFVTPPKVIIEPEGFVRCSVNIPRKPILLLTKGRIGETEAIATLTILHGDESTRLRIKRICANQLTNDSLLKEWNEKCQGKLKLLCSSFPDEDIHYAKTNHFGESSNVLWNLLDELQQKEVTLTYDLDLDNSVARLSSDLDETLHFHTINEDLLNATIVSDLKKM